jgi:hypothetical protein
MAVECLFVQRAGRELPGRVVYAWINFRWARQPNSAEFQQLVGALFVSGCMQRLGKELGKGARAKDSKQRSENDQQREIKHFKAITQFNFLSDLS